MAAPEFDKGTLARTLIGPCGQVTGLPDRRQAYGPSPLVKFLHSQRYHATAIAEPLAVTARCREAGPAQPGQPGAARPAVTATAGRPQALLAKRGPSLRAQLAPQAAA